MLWGSVPWPFMMRVAGNFVQLILWFFFSFSFTIETTFLLDGWFFLSLKKCLFTNTIHATLLRMWKQPRSGSVLLLVHGGSTDISCVCVSLCAYACAMWWCNLRGSFSVVLLGFFKILFEIKEQSQSLVEPANIINKKKKNWMCWRKFPVLFQLPKKSRKTKKSKPLGN